MNVNKNTRINIPAEMHLGLENHHFSWWVTNWYYGWAPTGLDIMLKFGLVGDRLHLDSWRSGYISIHQANTNSPHLKLKGLVFLKSLSYKSKNYLRWYPSNLKYKKWEECKKLKMKSQERKNVVFGYFIWKNLKKQKSIQNICFFWVLLLQF